jgi:hypothetical protein
MLQIDPIQFITQAIALSVWVMIAAAVYSVVEQLVDAQQDKP